MTDAVRNNPELNRYELAVGDAVAVVTYQEHGGTLIFNHTEVPDSLSGQGVGSRLARGVLDDARARGMAVIPRCAFIASYIERHPEYRDLVADRS